MSHRNDVHLLQIDNRSKYIHRINLTFVLLRWFQFDYRSENCSLPPLMNNYFVFRTEVEHLH
jgi:hypothetical protein